MKPSLPNSNNTDVFIVTTLCFGWFILGSIQAVTSGFPTSSFTNASFLSLILLELMLAIAAIGYLHLRGHAITHFIPAPTGMGSLIGIALYALATLAAWPLTAFVASSTAAQPVDIMVANSTISLGPLVGVSVVNGVYEETFLLAYLQRTLEGAGAAFALGFSLLIRVMYHLYQGPAGAVSVLVFGLVLGLYYLRSRKLWPVVFAHIFADIAGFSMR